MSSNIKVQRICQHCDIEFIARTTVTKYCTAICAKRAYKARKRNEKIEVSVRETNRIKSIPFEILKEKEFLTVREVAILLNCSKQTIYKLVNSGKLKAVNIKEKKTIVRRKEINQLFES